MKTLFIATDQDGTRRTIELLGRNAWALSELIRNGGDGCTPITHPGPRWSAYVFNLRHEYGLAIETVNEPHKGPFPGTHARYVLRQPVTILSEAEAA
jgi:hypothetical protein